MTRRERLLYILYREPGPVSGGELARRLGVSRQTVVSDIARLRGEGMNVLSTPQGYVLGTRPHFYREVLGIVHTPEQLPRELEILVGHGVSVEDVWIDHPPSTGEFTADSILPPRKISPIFSRFAPGRRSLSFRK